MVAEQIKRESEKSSDEENKKAGLEGSARAKEWLDDIGGPARNTKRKVSLQAKSAQNEAIKMRKKDEKQYFYWKGYEGFLNSQLANPANWRK